MGDTIMFEYLLQETDAPVVNFRFIIEDSFGYTASRDFSYFLSFDYDFSEPVLKCFYNPSIQSLEIRNQNPLPGSPLRVNIYDLSGRLLDQVQIMDKEQNIVRLDNLSNAYFLVRIAYRNRILHYRFIDF
jgi:hypothetical protein